MSKLLDSLLSPSFGSFKDAMQVIDKNFRTLSEHDVALFHLGLIGFCVLLVLLVAICFDHHRDHRRLVKRIKSLEQSLLSQKQEVHQQA